MENGKRIRAEDVISKLKDDGDFDRIRLKILRTLKHTEELRASIIASVTQSAAFNRPGAENMKPRQLSDAIYQEIGDTVMHKISDDLWNTIRNGDGIQTEIAQTVQLVYSKLLNPKLDEGGESSSHSDLERAQSGVKINGHVAASTGDIEAKFSDAEPSEPPGFAQLGSNQVSNGNISNDHIKNNHMGSPKDAAVTSVLNNGKTNGKASEINNKSQTNGSLESLVHDEDEGAPPGFGIVMKEKNPDNDNDEDPEVPPGFS